MVRVKIYKNFNIKKQHHNAIILIGNFDGLHLGHQKLFNEAQKYKKKFKLNLGVVTFDPIPKMFFNKKIKNYRISNFNQKITYFDKYKVDFIINKKFDKTFSKIECNSFIEKYLYKKLKSKFLFVSNNFKFGYKRKGDVFLCDTCSTDMHSCQWYHYQNNSWGSCDRPPGQQYRHILHTGPFDCSPIPV